MLLEIIALTAQVSHCGHFTELNACPRIMLAAYDINSIIRAAIHRGKSQRVND
jgi:hypothetical protein